MSDLDILNQSLAGEHFAIAAYEAALASGLLDGPTAEAARAFQSDHKQHRGLLSEQIVSRGGTPVSALAADDYAESYPALTTAAEIVAYAIELEASAARGLVASVAAYEDRHLALLAAQIGGVEAQHWAVLLSARGSNPVPLPIIQVMSATSPYAA